MIASELSMLFDRLGGTANHWRWRSEKPEPSSAARPLLRGEAKHQRKVAHDVDFTHDRFGLDAAVLIITVTTHAYLRRAGWRAIGRVVEPWLRASERADSRRASDVSRTL